LSIETGTGHLSGSLDSFPLPLADHQPYLMLLEPGDLILDVFPVPAETIQAHYV